jgi:hypothetical protein
MKRLLIGKIFILILVILTGSLSAQHIHNIKGRIVDSTGNPIPYVEITFRDKGTTTWKDGTFYIELWEVKTKDTLNISRLGYKTKKISIKDYLNKNKNTIELEKKSYEIDKVKVIFQKNYRRKKIKKYGIFRKPSKAYISMGKITEQLAVYIPNKKGRYGIVQNLQFYIVDECDPSQKFRVHLYEYDSINNKPGKELLPKPIYVSASKGGKWVVVNIEKYNIEFPSLGMFVAIERLPGKPEETYITIGSREYKLKKDNVCIGGAFEKKGKRVTWYFRHGKWMRTRPPRRNEIFGNAMMAAEVLIYK